MVHKKGYLSEEELIELLALNGMLPGPTSTQTIVSIGYKVGGRLLALFTLLVWALPVLTLMTLASFLYTFLEQRGLSGSVLRFIGPMAVGFIIYAAVRIGRKVVVDKTSAALFLFSVVVTFYFRQPWVFPLVLLFGGAATATLNREAGMWNSVPLRPPWRFFLLFAVIAIGALVLATISAASASFYRAYS